MTSKISEENAVLQLEICSDLVRATQNSVFIRFIYACFAKKKNVSADWVVIASREGEGGTLATPLANCMLWRTCESKVPLKL